MLCLLKIGSGNVLLIDIEMFPEDGPASATGTWVPEPLLSSAIGAGCPLELRRLRVTLFRLRGLESR